MSSRQPCGTTAAYRRHIRHGETPDAECRSAWAAYNQQQWKGNPITRAKVRRRGQARRNALERLKALHPTQFRALYDEEMASPALLGTGEIVNKKTAVTS